LTSTSQDVIAFSGTHYLGWRGGLLLKFPWRGGSACACSCWRRFHEETRVKVVAYPVLNVKTRRMPVRCGRDDLHASAGPCASTPPHRCTGRAPVIHRSGVATRHRNPFRVAGRAVPPVHYHCCVVALCHALTREVLLLVENNCCLLLAENNCGDRWR